jgi:CubicO group peptidase (beta-lactamase class C family)
LLLCCLAGAAAGRAADRVDDYVRAEMRKQHIPGLSLAVVKDGKVIKAKGYGLADVELSVPATAQTVYQIGSITKQFTAAAVMLLAEEGKIGLDDKIAAHLDGTPDTWKEVTVRHLLTHTSGIKSYTGLPNFMSVTARLSTTKDGLIKLMAGYPLEFSPGEKWNYSNTGYFLLGLLIEKASGVSYARFLKERVFAPLGMTSTHLNDLKDIIPHRASGYVWDKGVLGNAPVIDMSWPYAAGALVSTVTDLAKWDAALDTDKLLKKASREAMWTPAKLTNGKTAGYGLGWGVGRTRGRRSLSHGGGIPGFITYKSRFPDDRLTVVVLTNLAPSNPGTIAQGLAGLYNEALLPPTLMKAAQTDPDPAMTRNLDAVLGDIAAGKESPLITAGWGATLRNLPPQAREELASWRKEQKAFTFLGADEITGPAAPDERNGEPVRRVCYYKMTTAAGPAVYWTFYLTPDGKVADAEPQPVSE